MARHPRQFGVSPVNMDSINRWDHRMSSVEQPLPEELNLQIQRSREQFQAAAIPDIAHGRTVDAAWTADFSFGPVTRPIYDNLLGYKWILKQGDGAQGLQFNPGVYGVFDRIIVNKCGVDNTGMSRCPAFNSAHPHHDDFAPLRRNLAMLRNYLLAAELFPDGKIDNAGDTKNSRRLGMIQQMADRLGEALGGPPPPKSLFGRWGVTMKRLFAGRDLAAPDVSAFLVAANVPDRGAEMMYNYLLSLKKNPPFGSYLPFVRTPKEWPLIPIEDTPFSEANMQKYSVASVIEGCANEIERNVTQLRAIDTLSQDTKRISVDEAHIILRGLRKLLGSDNALSELNVHNASETVLSEVTDPAQEESRMMMSVIRAFKETIGDITAFDRNLLRNPALQEAVDVIEMIGYRVKVEAQVALAVQGDMFAAKRMGQRIAETPERFKNEIPLKDLVSKLETGLNTASTIRQSIPPSRLAEAQAQRAQTQAQMQAMAATAQRNAQLARNRAAAAKASGDVMTRARVTQTNSQQAARAAERLEHERLLKEQQAHQPKGGPSK